MRRHFHLITAGLALCLVVLVITLACSRNTEEQNSQRADQRASELTTVGLAMKWTWAGTMSPYFAARHTGLFRDAGLNLELMPGGVGSPSIQQVLFGRAEFGITGAHDLALARAKSQPLVAVAVIFKHSPTCLVSLTSRNIQTPKDLVGRTVEMTDSDNSAFEYRSMLARNGVAFDSVKTLNWNYSYDALISGLVDATVAYENDQAITLQSDEGFKISVLAPRKFGVTPYADVLFTTEETIREEPGLVGRVVSTVLASWDWAANHPDSTIALFLSDPEITPLGYNHEQQLAVLKRSLDFVRGDATELGSGNDIPRLGLQELARWEETISLLTEHRSLLLGGEDTSWRIPSAQECFTNRWVELYEMQKATSRGTR